MTESSLRTVAEGLKRKGGHYLRIFVRVEALMGWLNHGGRCFYCDADLIDAANAFCEGRPVAAK
jgi:hypothetical protein